MDFIMQRIRITIRGAVQGVGFRPFVYRLAAEMSLPGWVTNSPAGVFIEAEGAREDLVRFLLRIEQEKPDHSFIQSMEVSFLDPAGYTQFDIRESDATGEKTALILPDIATCSDCLREINDPEDRRYRYPFTTCTNCGPRFTVVDSLPYDRPNTTMKIFPMCDRCTREYLDPLNRRFHAQTNACPVCGPQIELWDDTGEPMEVGEDSLAGAVEAIRTGRIVALKGLGGYQLLVDGCNEEAVQRLRQRKQREEKPFALMYPSIESVEHDCRVSAMERRLLLSPEAPIVLLSRGENARVAPSIVGSRNPFLGVMLPYTPLHHLLMSQLGIPIVATSGNLSDEPICTDEWEAKERLRNVADVFLIHNRPIARHMDDSIVRVILGRELVLRRARGYAPLPIQIRQDTGGRLAVGGHLKNTVAAGIGRNVFLSQHIGDLETEQALNAFHKVTADFKELYEIQPAEIVCDLHPDYLSTQYARSTGLPVVPIQHHCAHVAACMAENDLDGPVLGVSWDGTGYGPDGTIWGGEFLLDDEHGFHRVAAFRPFRLPGGDRAVREPRRSALGLLYELFGDQTFGRNDLPSLRAFRQSEIKVLRKALADGIQSPETSSAGRLFDALSSLLDLRQMTTFEGQAAMELEFAALEADTRESYEIRLISGREKEIRLDWEPMIRAVLADREKELPAGLISARFHNALAAAITEVARAIGRQRVVLTGGCFQNKALTEASVHSLEQAGFRPYCHQRVPPNDGGIALGQIYAAARYPLHSVARASVPASVLPARPSKASDPRRAETPAPQEVRRHERHEVPPSSKE